jgi:hypothetical protein
MSLGPLAGLAGTSLAQVKGSEVDRTQQSVANQERRVANLERAEKASGIGQADGEDHETGERDADGRRLWEEQGGHPNDEAVPEAADSLRQSKDPSGAAGNLLDLSG